MITEDYIFTVNGKNQEEVLKEISIKAQSLGIVSSVEELYSDLLLREEEGSTGFGNNIALPHSKCQTITKTAILIARCSNKIEWKAIDNQPIDVCICLLVAGGNNTVHLQLLSKFARKLIYDDFIQQIKQSSPSELVNVIEEVIK